MSDDLSQRADDLAFIPETFREWIIRSRRADITGKDWRHYTILMLAYAEAFARAPMTAEDCNATDIIAHLDKEIESLSGVIRYIMRKDEEGH